MTRTAAVVAAAVAVVLAALAAATLALPPSGPVVAIPAPPATVPTATTNPTPGAGGPSAALVSCPDPSTAQQCFTDGYAAVAERSGTPAALASITAAVAGGDSQLLAHCHEVLHTLAASGLAESAGDPTAALGLLDDLTFCSWGYAHGVWDQWLSQYSVAELAAGITAMCGDVPSPSIARDACYHILGHSLARTDRAEVPATLEACMEIPDHADRQYCLGGGFMELFLDPDGLAAARGNLAAAADPCPAVADAEMRDRCFLEAAPQIAAAADYDAVDMFAVCAAQQGPDQVPCERAIGRALATAAGYQADESIRRCTDSRLPAESQDSCLIAIAGTVAFTAGGDTAAGRICDATTEAARAECAAVVDDHLRASREGTAGMSVAD